MFIVLAIRHRDKKAILSAAGILLYTVYVVHIGGDFMLGRHLTVQYILSLAGVLTLVNEYPDDKILFRKLKISKFAVISIIAALLWACTGAMMIRYNSLIYTSAGDERTYYFHEGDTRTMSLIARSSSAQEPLAEFSLEETADMLRKVEEDNLKGYIYNTGAIIYGFEIYYDKAYKDITLIDGYGVMDPLLSQLPAMHLPDWRTGHVQRMLPEGYRESIEQGANLITDPSLHEYYDKLLLIIQGDDLFAPERLQAVWDMMTGKYDHLIREYVENNPRALTG